MSTRKDWRCSLCKRRAFTAFAVDQHIKAMHKTKPAKPEHSPKPKPRTDEEESYADRAIQASMDRAAGIHNPDADWLLP